ncbi:MAG: hypothetical protein A2X68_12240 [Ignavibacteria bacterium GWC2_56_12]|nr:MAG: hypothetical protein A2X68_12240 [Ignavibacteria bacterium GWC2_56_12]
MQSGMMLRNDSLTVKHYSRKAQERETAKAAKTKRCNNNDTLFSWRLGGSIFSNSGYFAAN